MTAAQEAYKRWKAMHKVNLQVYTDEQLFCIGYEAREKENESEEVSTPKVNKKKTVQRSV